MTQLMRPQPFHALTAIFCGYVEPWYPDDQLLVMVDEWGDVIVVCDPADDCTGRPTLLTNLLENSAKLLQQDLTKHDAAYGDGVFLQGAWMSETDDREAHLLVHHVMPISSLYRGCDTVQVCLRRVDLHEVLQPLKPDTFDLFKLMPSFPIMTQFGVLDPEKLRAVALDMQVDQLVLKNSYSFWNPTAKPHRNDGRGGPAWTLWTRDQDF